MARGLLASIVASIVLLPLSSTAAPAPAPAPAPSLEPDGAVPQRTLILAGASPLGTAEAEATLGVIAKHLSVALGRPVKRLVFDSYVSLAEALGRREVDLAYAPPLAYVMATREGRPVAVRKVLRGGFGHYRSVLFVLKTSGIRGLGDLRGKSVAWVQPGSASGNMVPRHELRAEGLDPDELFGKQWFIQDHLEVCRAVAEGKVEVGASYSLARRGDPASRVDSCRVAGLDPARFRIVYAGDFIPNDVVAAREGLGAELVRQVGDILDGLAKEPAGREVLVNGYRGDGFARIDEGEFGSVREAMDLAPTELPEDFLSP